MNPKTAQSNERRSRLVNELRLAYANGELDGDTETDVNVMQHQIKQVRDRVATATNKGRHVDHNRLMAVQRENHKLSCPQCEYVIYRQTANTLCACCGFKGDMTFLWRNPEIHLIDGKPTYINSSKPYPSA